MQYALAPYLSLPARFAHWTSSAQAALVAATVLWSGNFTAGRALRDALDPLTLNFWRWAIALAVLLPCTAPALRRQAPLLRRHLPFVAALALTCVVVPHVCIYQALRTSSVVNALLLLNLVPLAVVLGSRLVFRQPVAARAWIGMAVAGLAAMVLVARGDPLQLLSAGFAPGDLWMGITVASAAAHALLLRRTPEGLEQAPLLCAATAVAVAAMAAWLGATGGIAVPTDPAVWAALAYMGAPAAALAFLLWNGAVARVGPHRAAPYMYLMPAHGMVLSALLLGEAVLPVQVAAGVVLFAGLWLTRQPPARG